MKSISIIIPVYNEENFIRDVLLAVLKAKTFGLKKEVVVINDGSTDNTWKILHQLKSTIPKNTLFKLINFSRNCGKGAALKTGIIASTGDIVIIQDADLEYSPDDYPLLLNPFFNNRADVVYGSRFATDRPHRVLYFWHSVANFIVTSLSNILTNLNLSDVETGYKVFKGDLIRKIAQNLKSRGFGFEVEITSKIAAIKGLKIYEVGISYSGRSYEEGKKISWIDGVKALFQIFWFNFFKKNPWEEERLEKVARNIRFGEGIRYIRKSKPVTIADLGCGSDIKFYHFIKDRGIKIDKYYGIDSLLNVDILNLQNKNVKLLNSPLKKNVPFESNSMDYVVSFASMEHFDNPKAIFNDSIRVLKKGGKAIFTTPNPRAKIILEFLAFKLGLLSKREIGEHKNYFGKEDLLKMIDDPKKVKVRHKYFELGFNNLLVIEKNV